jgi:hypothetical protein
MRLTTRILIATSTAFLMTGCGEAPSPAPETAPPGTHANAEQHAGTSAAGTTTGSTAVQGATTMPSAAPPPADAAQAKAAATVAKPTGEPAKPDAASVTSAGATTAAVPSAVAGAPSPASDAPSAATPPTAATAAANAKPRATAASLTPSAGGTTKPVRMTIDQLPDEVKATVAKEAPTAKRVTKSTGKDGKDQYRARYLDSDGTTMLIVIGADGGLISKTKAKTK